MTNKYISNKHIKKSYQIFGDILVPKSNLLVLGSKSESRA